MEANVVNFTTSSWYSCSDGTGLNRNSVTIEYWDTSREPVKTHALISATFTLCFFLVGLPSNLLIMAGILWQRLYREPSYILLLNLTIANFLTCVLFMPFSIISGFAGGFIFGNTDSVRCGFCQFGLMYSIFTTFSFHVLVLLSVDRFLFIKFPMKYHKWVTTSRMTFTVFGLWVFCIVLALLPLFGIGDFEFRYYIASCILRLGRNLRLGGNLSYAIFVMSESMVLLVILGITNVWIFCIVQHHLRRMYSVKNTGNDMSELMEQIRKNLRQTKNKKQLQLVKVFVLTFLAHAITWFPVIVQIIGTALAGDGEYFPAWFYVFVYVSLISFTVIHPIIQVVYIPEIKSFIAVFLCRQLTTSKLAFGKCGSVRCCAACNGSSTQKCLIFLSVSVLPLRDEITDQVTL